MNISAQEAHRRLTSSQNLARLAPTAPLEQIAEHHDTKELRPKRGPEVPAFIRDVTARLSIDPSNNSTQRQIGEAFGISQTTVSHNVTGKIGGRPATEEQKQIVQSRRDAVQDIALQKLMKSLNLVDEEKLTTLDPKEQTLVAKNLASVFHSLEQKEAAGANQPTVQVVIYSPEIKSEEKYRTVDV